MEIDIITLFPGMFTPIINESMIKRAQEKKSVKIKVHNLRDYSANKHRKVDDRPFGGGPGMVICADPVFRAVEKLKKNKIKTRVVYVTPDGKQLTQPVVKKFTKYKHLIIICGHYEGIDQRIRKELVTDEISIGDYVLTCGELPAMVFIDAVVRLLPGVLGCSESCKYESFEDGLLDFPHYTRPENYRGMKVPKVLLSGNHAEVQAWREKKALEKTKKRRPDLLGRSEK